MGLEPIFIGIGLEKYWDPGGSKWTVQASCSISNPGNAFTTPLCSMSNTYN